MEDLDPLKSMSSIVTLCLFIAHVGHFFRGSRKHFPGACISRLVEHWLGGLAEGSALDKERLVRGREETKKIEPRNLADSPIP